MPTHRGTETTFELTTIERLEQQGYTYQLGLEMDRPHDEVVFRDVLRANLANRYPDLPAPALDEAVARISLPAGVDTIRRNKAFHELLTRGFEVKVEHADGRKEHRHIHPIQWDKPTANDFRVVNQLPIHGKNDRRPDVIIYINGLPLVIFELKNPYAIKPTVDDAHNQIQHYIHDIGQLFDFNALVIVSDGVTTLHGMWTSDEEWYAPWKSINGFDIEPNTTGSMKALVEGLFPKERLLQYLRDFIIFEVDNDRISKKGGKYHQFYAIRLAAQKTVETVTAGSDKRIGVIWHTTGSGKSLSMAFLVGILRRLPELENPSFLIQVDRTDLDDQLHDQFVAARSLVGEVKHAESVDDLRDLLRTEGGEVIFSTIEKFRLKKDNGELAHPVLSARSNIIIIADEAHRSQYGFAEGYARYLAEALPNARRIGFTGTPVSFGGSDTVEVFGDVIHTYDIRQSQEDHATVPIYYAPRQVRLHLTQTDIDAALKELSDEAGEASELERRKSRWAALAAAAGTKKRLKELAEDLLSHFLDRTATLAGKAMVVCMTRANCVRLYDELTKLPGCPEVKVIMTGNLSEDPPEWNKAGHLTTKAQRDTIKKRMIVPDDPLKIVIVCDMWLTGTDIPCLHTLYIDKPMQGHTMIQAISRVNRVFSDKPHGLIVDYIGIGDELRDATAKYTQGGGRGEPAPNIEDSARPLFFECLESVRSLLPEGQEYGGWRHMSHIEMEDLYSLVYGELTEDDERCEQFVQAEARLTSAFLLVKHLEDCRLYADEVIFCQRVRKQLRKIAPGGKKKGHELDKAVRDLVDDHVESEGVVDIFKVAGIEQADISILDDDFLQTFKNKSHEDLRLKLLQRLLDDAIRVYLKRNPQKAKSFHKMLEDTLAKYHNRLVTAAAVIQEMIEIRKQMQGDQQRAKELHLEDDELAFYDAVAENFETLYDQQFLCDLIHDVVQTVRRNIKVDWTEPHREDVKAAVRAAVRRVLRKRCVREEDFEPLLTRIMEQAEVLYADNYWLMLLAESH
ncbi:MAG TPA: type I restriction endonuclease subunit R [Desulfuromonadales bacterium]|nr:type I restriction endonuclease subunit R [Desulfuromonadales bacterium]